MKNFVRYLRYIPILILLGILAVGAKVMGFFGAEKDFVSEDNTDKLKDFLKDKRAEATTGGDSGDGADSDSDDS